MEGRLKIIWNTLKIWFTQAKMAILRAFMRLMWGVDDRDFDL